MKQEMETGVGPESQVSKVHIILEALGRPGLSLSICKMRGFDWPVSGLPEARGYNKKGPDSSRSSPGLAERGVAGAAQGPRVIFCSSA